MLTREREDRDNAREVLSDIARETFAPKGPRLAPMIIFGLLAVVFFLPFVLR